MEPMEKHEGVLDDVREFFNQKVKKFGPTHQAADYNSRESQEIRFDQLLKIVNTRSKFSLIDYGCGYGELIHYMFPFFRTPRTSSFSLRCTRRAVAMTQRIATSPPY